MESSWKVLEGDCLEVMREMDEASVDAVVCDPPYGLEFMGKEWDRLAGDWAEEGDSQPWSERPKGGNDPFQRNRPRFHAGRPMQAWHEAWARDALRVLKPGGHMLAFGGTRTYHRLVCAIEDAGFEIRDTVQWIYGSGFPKSLNVGKAIDKMAGAEREDIGPYTAPDGKGRCNDTGMRGGQYAAGNGHYDTEKRITAPATEAAKEWDGWGSALKPAHEPIVLARKPIAASSIARQVLSTGTGAINVDGTRVGYQADDLAIRTSRTGNHAGKAYGAHNSVAYTGGELAAPNTQGRFPANLLLSHSAECRATGEVRRVKVVGATAHKKHHGGGMFMPDDQHDHAGYRDPDGTETVEAYECAPGCPVRLLDEQSGQRPGATSNSSTKNGHAGTGWGVGDLAKQEGYADKGGASRFFQRFDAEASPGFLYQAKAGRRERNAGLPAGETSSHPTVKPIALMRYLVGLITPPGGTVLDPFCGSGSTGCAAVQEGFGFIGIEKEPEYAEIARRRIAHWSQPEEVRAKGKTRSEAFAAEQEAKRAELLAAGEPEMEWDDANQSWEPVDTLF